MVKNKKAPAPLIPKAQNITTVEPLLPIARQIVKRKGYPMMDGLALQPGMKVLMIVDSTNDLLVQEAFQVAIREAGGKLGKIMLHGYPELKDPVGLVDTLFSRNWWPDWVWQAARGADIIMQGAMLKNNHAPNLPLDTRKKPKFMDMEWTADLLASNYETFPVEVRHAIDRSAWELLAYAKKMEFSDLEGTSLRVILEKEKWEEEIAKMKAREGFPYMPGHLSLHISFEKSEGLLVTSSLTFGGTVPRTRLTLEGGRITKVEEGGKFGETLRRSFEEFKELTSPITPGAGINWLLNFGICTHPKTRRSAFVESLSGSARIHAYAFGHRRSGVIHVPIGEGLLSKSHKIIRHIDQYFTTLVADGKKVIERGHLLALDDPEVHKIARKYGDPKELLSEEWIPAISGVNVP